MKSRILFLLLFLPFAASVSASPFLVSDPTLQTVTHCAVYVDGGAKTESPVVHSTQGYACRHDLAGIKPGSHTVIAAFVNKDPVWGDIEGEKSTPFLFDAPASPSAPVNIRLTP